jgi:hypothetical protein
LQPFFPALNLLTTPVTASSSSCPPDFFLSIKSSWTKFQVSHLF